MKNYAVKTILAGILLTFISACATCRGLNVPIMTVAKPKVYLDDQVHKITADRIAKINELSKNINATAVQESFAVQQARKLSGTVAIAPAGTAASAPLDTIAVPVPPIAQGDVGRTAPELMQALMNADQDVMGYELLYLGDAGILDNNHKIALLRFDVSINKYFIGSDFNKFAFMHCSIEGATNDKKFNNDNIYVYTLAPEISSVIARESLASAALTDLAAQLTEVISGANAQASARLQRTLQESMLTLMEYPVQFALYGENSNEFSFAFGPRRKLSKRNWFYRNILFMDPYKVEYFIGPGSRDCYALVVMPKVVSTLQIKLWVADNFGTFKPKPAYASGNDKKPAFDKMISDTEFIYRTLNNHQAGKQPNQCTDKNQQKQTEDQQHQPTYIYEHDTALKNATNQAIASENPQIVPGYLYPKLSNTLLVISDNVISPEVTVFVGPVAIPKEKVKILGRSRLLVTVEPDDRLQLLTKEKAIYITLVYPDRAIEKSETFKIELRDSTETPKKPRVVFKPDTVKAGQSITVISNDKTLNFEKIKSVVISSMPAITSFHEKKPRKVVLSIPTIKEIPATGVSVAVDIIFEDGYSPQKLSFPEALKFN